MRQGSRPHPEQRLLGHNHAREEFGRLLDLPVARHSDNAVLAGRRRIQSGSLNSLASRVEQSRLLLLRFFRRIPDREDELADSTASEADVAAADGEGARFAGGTGEADGVEGAGRDDGRESVACERYTGRTVAGNRQTGEGTRKGNASSPQLDTLNLQLEQEWVLQRDKDLDRFVLHECWASLRCLRSSSRVVEEGVPRTA